jgi:hypothetical protein
MKKISVLLKSDPTLQADLDQLVETRIAKTRKKLEWEICEHLRTVAGLRAQNNALRDQIEQLRSATWTARLRRLFRLPRRDTSGGNDASDTVASRSQQDA